MHELYLEGLGGDDDERWLMTLDWRNEFSGGGLR
jgi:hypothetical protein